MQVLTQLADAHTTHLALAVGDSGTPLSGQAWASRTAEKLRQAAALLQRVEARLDTASRSASRIAKQPEPEPTSRFVSVVFLQGQDAEPVLGLLHYGDAGAAIKGLSR